MVSWCRHFWGSEKCTYRTFWKIGRYRKGLSYSGTGRPGPHPSPLKPGGWPVSREGQPRAGHRMPFGNCPEHERAPGRAGTGAFWEREQWKKKYCRSTIPGMPHSGAGYISPLLRDPREVPDISHDNRQRESGKDFLHWQVCKHRGEQVHSPDSQHDQKCAGGFLWEFSGDLFLRSF